MMRCQVLHHKKFNTRLEKQPQLARHLFSTSSLLDDTENHRSHWFLGTGDFSRIPVAYSWEFIPFLPQGNGMNSVLRFETKPDKPNRARDNDEGVALG